MYGIDERVPVDTLWRDPYPFFAWLRREAPVWQLPGENAYLLSTWAAVAEATSRPEDFSNHFRYLLLRNPDGTLGTLETGPTGPDVFAGEDPPLHTAHRKIFFAGLTPKRADALEPAVVELVDRLLDPLLAGGGGDVATGLAHPLPIRVIVESVAGFRDADVAKVGNWMIEGSRLAGGLLTLDEIVERSAEVAGMMPWTEAQLDRAIAEAPTDDLLGAAAAAVRDGSLTHEQAAFTLMVFVGAGAETTTSLVGIAIAELAGRPDLQDRLRADPALVPQFVEEVLRYESPFRFHPRTAARETELGGVTIPEGALLLLLWASANRDETVFDDADELVVDRANAHLHFGFGRGVHHCVGAALARLEARVVLRRLLERTTSFALDPGSDIRWADSIWIHRPDELAIVMEVR
jgi:cytochrome P450 family 144